MTALTPQLRLLTQALAHKPLGEAAVDHRQPLQPAARELRRGPIRVLLADGRTLVRAGYRALLERDESISVVAEAGSAQQAIALAAQTCPDVALIDHGLPGFDDAETAFAVVSHPAFSDVAVMLIAPGEGDERTCSALRAGAVGLVYANDPPGTLTHAVRLLASGHGVLPRRAFRQLLAELGVPCVHRYRASRELSELTAREREVVALAARGLTNGEIGARLTISPATAKTHISRAMSKLHAHHRAELVVSAYENGLARPPELPSVA